MQVKRFVGGPLPTNCYLLTDESTGSTAVVDPGFESEELTNAVLAAGCGNVKAILLTHGHFDHIAGVAKLKNLTRAKVYLYTDELAFVSDGNLNLAGMFYEGRVEPFGVDVPLNDGEEFELGSAKIRVISTPGHTCGGCCFQVEDALFTGDTLMKLSCGRTDFPTGSYSQLLDSLRRLRDLPGDYHVYPGHGSESSLAYERRNNSFMGPNP